MRHQINNKKPNKGQRKNLREAKDQQHQQNNGLHDIRRVVPLTDNQSLAFDSFDSGRNLVLHGSTGSGKTFLALYFALSAMIDHIYQKVIIIRSVVPSRDMGFLPGSHADKMKVYEAPYYTICNQLYGRADAYDILKKTKQVEFMSTSFMRGLTFSNCVVIVDEMQNLNWMELKTIITRLDDDCRIIFCGDTIQSDFERHSEKKGLISFLKVAKAMKSVDIVHFGVADIVRGGLPKEFLLACNAVGVDQ